MDQKCSYLSVYPFHCHERNSFQLQLQHCSTIHPPPPPSMKPDPHSRTTSHTHDRTRTPSACYRHPSQPVTGFCALCLRDRLSGLDTSGSPDLDISGASSSSRLLRRSKSVVVVGRCEEVDSGASDQRRRSCDVRASSTLSDLFNRADDVCEGVEKGVEIESSNLGFGNGGDVRVADEVMDDVVEEDLKTMKEHIDLELQSSRKSNALDLKVIAGSLLGAAFVFSKKLKKWRPKEKTKSKKWSDVSEIRDKDLQSEVADYGLGRRSCDTEPRFSIDANRMSVDEPHRASWDGYLIARTIPRLTPMLSVVDNVMLGPMSRADNLQMGVISEDVGNSSDSGQSNSNSSSSNRRSSSDRSSSIRSSSKGLRLEDAKASPTNDVIFRGTKLVITERELKDWHLNSLKHGNLENVKSISMGVTSLATGSALDGYKKAKGGRWRKVCNLWGYKHRLSEQKGGDFVGNGCSEKCETGGLENGGSSAKLIRSSCALYESAQEISKVREDFVLERNKSGRHSMSDIDSGLLRFHLTPFRNYSKSKSSKSKVKNSATARNGVLLN